MDRRPRVPRLIVDDVETILHHGRRSVMT
jgi:hypothetical protein